MGPADRAEVPEATSLLEGVDTPIFRDTCVGRVFAPSTAGVQTGPLFEACTLDVAVIGNDAAANVFVNAIPQGRLGIMVVW